MMHRPPAADLAAWMGALSGLPPVAKGLLSLLEGKVWKAGDSTGPYEIKGGPFDGGFLLDIPPGRRGYEPYHAALITTRGLWLLEEGGDWTAAVPIPTGPHDLTPEAVVAEARRRAAEWARKRGQT